MKISKSDIFSMGLIAGILLMGLIAKYQIPSKIKDIYYNYKAIQMLNMLEEYEDKEEDVITIEIDDGTVA